MLGRALVKASSRENAVAVTVDRSDLDLTNPIITAKWLNDTRPDAIIVAAGGVGGLYDNISSQAEMCSQNLSIALSVIEGAHKANINNLVYIAPAATYPLNAPLPLKEENLLDGPLDPFHLRYASAKRAGIAHCQAMVDQNHRHYQTALPTNCLAQAVGEGSELTLFQQ